MARLNFIVRGGADFSSINKSIRQTQSKLAGFKNAAGKSMSLIGSVIKGALAYVSVRAMYNFGKNAVEMASNLTEVQNVVDVTFGQMAGYVNTFADNAIESFGLSELSAKKFSSYLGAMLKSSGVTGVAVKDMAINLTQLSADMASFYDLPHEEMFEKIMGGMAGAVKPLRTLGINMTIANLESFALSKGITKSWSAMSQAEKTLLRYNYLMKVSSDSQGDFARTQHTWANQTKILQEKLKAFSTELGQGLINIFTHIVHWLNEMIEGLILVARYFRAFTELVFGAAGTNKGAVVDIDTETPEEGLEDLEDQAEKTKKALMGFDEINQLDLGVRGDGGIDGGIDVGDVYDKLGDVPTAEVGSPVVIDINTEALVEKLRKLKELLQPITDAFGRLKEAIEPFAEKVGEGLRWFWDNVLVPFGTWVINKAIPAFLDLLAVSIDFCGSAIKFFKPFALWLWDNFLKPVAEWTGGAIISILDGLATGLGKISDWMTNNGSTVDETIEKLKGFAGAWDLIKRSVELAGGILSDMWTTITTAISKFTKGNGKELERFSDNIVKFFTTAWLFIETQWKLFLVIIDEVWKKYGKPLFDGIVEDISMILGGIITFINGVFSGDWEKALGGIGKIWGGQWNAMVDLVLVPLNIIIDLINGFLDLVDGIKLPDWLTGGTTIKVAHINRLTNPFKIKQNPVPNLPPIPPSSAIGVGGTQMGSSNYSSMTNAVASAVGTSLLSAQQFNATAPPATPAQVILNIDGNKLAKVMLPKLNKETERLGLKTILQTAN